MKLEIIKETKANGDIFLYIEREGVYIEDTMKYAGTKESTNQFKDSLESINKKFELIKGGIVAKKETLKTEEI